MIIQASRLIDGINLDKLADKVNKSQYSSFNSDSNDNIKFGKEPAPIHKVIKDEDAKLCDIYIKSKYTRIMKSKKMTLTNRKLKEIHVDLWGPYDLSLLSEKNYVALFLEEHI